MAWRFNHEYIIAVIGSTAVTFGTGAAADWMPTFFSRNFHVSLTEAGITVGIILVVAGILGSIIGSFLGDFFKNYVKQPYFIVSSGGALLASVTCFLALYINSYYFSTIMAFLCIFGVFINNGPVSAIIANSNDSSTRSKAFGFQIMCLHLFGDAISPTIVGWISDLSSLSLALNACVVAFFVGSGAFAFGLFIRKKKKIQRWSK